VAERVWGTLVKDFAIVGVRGYFRPRGAVSLAQAVEMVDAALEVACGQGLREVVVDVTGLTGFASPAASQRFFLITQWAQTVHGRARVAVIARPEFIDPRRFGNTVAANRGFQAQVFAAEADAVAWLSRLAHVQGSDTTVEKCSA